MALRYRSHAEEIARLLKQFEIKAGIVERRERSVVYISTGG